eukprot:9477339-Pyramimonas_sp.AAC.1
MEQLRCRPRVSGVLGQLGKDFLEFCGRRLVTWSDGESAIQALKREISNALPGCDVIFQESPAGEHAANGAVENAVEQMNGQVRVLILARPTHWGESYRVIILLPHGPLARQLAPSIA